MDLFKNLFNRFNNSPFSNATKKDKRQIIALIISIFVILISSRVYRSMASGSVSVSNDKIALIRKNLDSLNVLLAQSQQSSDNFARKNDYGKQDFSSSGQPEKKNPKDSIFKKREKEFFVFDPNTIDEENMYKLGWSTKQIESFINLRDKGKKFYVKKDFSTVFFIDNEKYKELEPYIKIDLSKVFNGEKQLDLNLASEDQLIEAGMNGSEAESVIKFRESVGFFYAPWQLSDAIKYDRANKLKSKFYTCMSVEIKKLKINDISRDELVKHPYFSEKQADAVMKFRDEKGRIKHLADFQTMNAFDDKEIKKIEKYVAF